MKTKVILLVLISIIISGINLYSCTIFYVVKDNKIYAGNNEDWKDPLTKMWFYPAENNKHGWIKFGFGSGFPQGGMNDQGLFWDGTAGPYLSMPLSEANKELYPNALMQKVMEECSNIEEVVEVFAKYYCEDQYKAQYLEYFTATDCEINIELLLPLKNQLKYLNLVGSKVKNIEKISEFKNLKK